MDYGGVSLSGDDDALAIPTIDVAPSATGGAPSAWDDRAAAAPVAAVEQPLPSLDVSAPSNLQLDHEPKAAPAPEAETGEKLKRKRVTGKWMLLGSVMVLLLVLVGGGAALALTDYGLFGKDWVQRTFFSASGDEELTSPVIRNARTRIAQDTYLDHRQAVSQVEREQRQGRGGEGLASFAIFLYELYELRYGESKQYGVAAERLAASLGLNEAETPAMFLGAAARKARQGELEPAKGLLRRLNELSPNQPDGLQLKGELNLRAGNHDQARRTYENLAQRENRSPRALFGLVRAFEAAGERDKSRPLIDELLKAQPNHVGALLAQARVAVDDGEDTAAFETVALIEGDKQQYASPLDRARGQEIQADILYRQEKLTKATAAYQAAFKLDDQSVRSHLGLGNIYYRRGEMTDALTHFKLARRIDPQNLAARLGYAEALISAVGDDNLQQARQTLQEAQNSHGDEPRVHFLLGRVLQEQNHPDESRQSYEKAIALKADYLEPYLALSDLLIKRERTDEAMKVLASARRALPHNPRIYVNMGLSHLDRDEYAEAEQEFRRALQAGPNHPDALFSLGITLRRMGRLNDAQAALERLSNIDSQYPGLVREQGLVLEQTGQPDRALAIYRAELERVPDDVDLKLRVAAASVQVDQCAEALVLLREVIRERPRSSEALFNQGRCLLSAGEVAEAERVLGLAVEVDGDNGLYRAYLGWAAMDNGNTDRAALELRRSVELDPTNPIALWRRGILYLHGAAPHSAVQDLERALELNPNMVEVYKHLAVAYDRMRRPDDAIRYFRLAIENDPDDFENYYHLAQIVTDQQGSREGTPIYEQAVNVGSRVDPKPPQYYDALFGYAAGLNAQGRVTEARRALVEYVREAPSGAVDRSEAVEMLEVIGSR
jgi:tetratricopeptide (TPR) repeat protein